MPFRFTQASPQAMQWSVPKQMPKKTKSFKSIYRLAFLAMLFSGFSNFAFSITSEDYQDLEPVIAKNIKQYFDSFYLAKQQNDSLLMADFLYEIAIAEQLRGANDSAFKKFTVALAIYKNFNDSLGIANCNNQLGSIFRYKGQYDRALGNYFNVLDSYNLMNDTIGKIKALNNIGITYRLLNDYNKAFTYYKNSEKLALEINSDHLATIYNSIGSFYWFQNQNDSALHYYKKGLKFKPVNLELQERRCAILNNIGNVFRDTEELDSAIIYYNKSLNLSESLGIINISAITLKNIGKTYYLQGKINTSLRFLNQGYILARKSKLAKTIIEIYHIKSLVYEDQKLYKKSLVFYKKYAQLQDSVISSQRLKKIADLEVNYEVQQLEKNQALLQNKIIKKDLSIAKNRNYFILGASIIIILILLIISIYFRSRINKKHRTMLQKANNLLEVRVQQRTYHLMKENEEHKKTEIKLRKAKEKAEESDRLKSAFLSNISHEIRTPMNAIVGFSNLLDKEATAEEISEYVKLINDNGVRLINLIDDIIDLSRIDSGQLQLNFSEVNVSDLVKNLEKRFTKSIKERGLDFIVNKPSEIKELYIHTDYSRLIQVLSNLISNSIKFTDKGTISLSTTKSNNQVVFKIMDTGIGIPENERESIFERFRTASQSNRKFFDGVGLGLSLCKEIVAMLNGAIMVESELEKGTTFTVAIPIK